MASGCMGTPYSAFRHGCESGSYHSMRKTAAKCHALQWIKIIHSSPWFEILVCCGSHTSRHHMLDM